MREDWIEVELGELTENPKNDIVDGPFGSNLKSDEYVDSGIPVFKIQNIKANQFVDKNINYVTFQKSEELKRHTFKKGDLIITKLGDPLGLCCKVPEKYEFGVIVADLIRFRSSNQIVFDKYLIYGINSILIQKQFKEITKGTTRPRVNLTIVRGLKFPLAPLPEQMAIAAKIEQLLSELDNSIANLKTAKSKLEIYRQAILKQAFEGNLTNPKNQTQKDLPKEWKWVKFGEVFLDKPQNGLYKPASQYGSGTRILRIDGFYNGVILQDYVYQRVKLNSEEISKYSLSIGDIVVNRVNSMSHLGKSGLVRRLDESTVFESNIMKIKLNFDLADSEYMIYYLSSIIGISELTKNAKQAVNQASINQQDVSNALIPICSTSEQKQIVQEIETRLSVCDKLNESIDQSLEKSQALRQSILKKAFEGKLLSEDELQTCRQQADWEPAAKLLERIKNKKNK